MPNLTLKQLRAVAEIVRHGTITRAAAQMHVTPAALTARLKQLEDEVGLALFDRTGSGLRVTEAGRRMLVAVEEVESVLQRCVEELDAIKGVRAGRVSVAVVSTAKYFAPQLIGAFARRHPGVDVRLTVGNREATLAALRDHAVDLAIMGRPGAEFATDSRTFGEHPMVIVAAPEHPLSRRRKVPLPALAGERFLVREPGSGTRATFERLAGRIAADGGVQIGMEIDSNETIKQAVMAGLGIALISAHTIEAELEAGRLVVLNVEDLPILRHWLLVRRADHALGPGAQAFWSFVLDEGRGLLPQRRFRAAR